MKEVNQGLCDDGLVDTDKIGSGNFFWCVRCLLPLIDCVHVHDTVEDCLSPFLAATHTHWLA